MVLLEVLSNIQNLDTFGLYLGPYNKYKADMFSNGYGHEYYELKVNILIMMLLTVSQSSLE